MGKYMRKAKVTGDVALMEVSQSSLGIRTRAKTLALRRLQTGTTTPPSPPEKCESCYLVLRSRRLEKLPFLKDTKKQQTARSKAVPEDSCSRNPDACLKSRLKVTSAKSGSKGSVSISCSSKQMGYEKEMVASKSEAECDCDLGIEASFGENNLEFEGRERSTRESTPCSLIRDSHIIGTPGSTTRRTSFTAANQRTRNALRNLPTSHEMEEFFACAEQQQQRLFIDKYNFDIMNDMPLPGRYEWLSMHL